MSPQPPPNRHPRDFRHDAVAMVRRRSSASDRCVTMATQVFGGRTCAFLARALRPAGGDQRGDSAPTFFETRMGDLENRSRHLLPTGRGMSRRSPISSFCDPAAARRTIFAPTTSGYCNVGALEGMSGSEADPWDRSLGLEEDAALPQPCPVNTSLHFCHWVRVRRRRESDGPSSLRFLVFRGYSKNCVQRAVPSHSGQQGQHAQITPRRLWTDEHQRKQKHAECNSDEAVGAAGIATHVSSLVGEPAGSGMLPRAHVLTRHSRYQ